MMCFFCIIHSSFQEAAQFSLQHFPYLHLKSEIQKWIVGRVYDHCCCKYQSTQQKQWIQYTAKPLRQSAQQCGCTRQGGGSRKQENNQIAQQVVKICFTKQGFCTDAPHPSEHQPAAGQRIIGKYCPAAHDNH